MQQEIQGEEKNYEVKIQIEQNHSELIEQVLSVDNESGVLKMNADGNQLVLTFSSKDASKVGQTVKHTIDQLLLILETINYTNK
ncbi:unnamed protein product (macronuclear) [Paramecium tetraurelia]|uniref:Transcription factor Pcc1 n=1 Tax=Paramecium tetraurelia TaxID=5888 RepID=A0BC30_PARTE|nr:uncharacterized protein GSPATT00000533001 [Paramecium tetraurelia]CAK56097.1 unnamed protein product [Paramecium tetraurelia]|eukprot:XP_001423495.1 hypothetical protein (macronuclear) [Paramecium tetraurelia strain d4-2]